MTLSELKPDVALKGLLKAAIDKASAPFAIEVFAQGEFPNLPTPDHFMLVEYNGIIETFTKPVGGYRGYLMVSVNIPSKDDDTFSIKLMNKLIGIVEQSCHYKSASDFFFEPAEYSVITPPTTGIITGRATAILNLKWHTTTT